MSITVPLEGFGGSAGGLNFEESATYPGCYFHTIDGVTEWLNPPMVLGTEYRTVERFKNKPVYAKSINFGSLPNATEKSVSSGLSKSYTIVEFTFLAKGSHDDGAYVSNLVDHTEGVSVWLGVNFSKIHCFTTEDFSAETGTVILKYTK